MCEWCGNIAPQYWVLTLRQRSSHIVWMVWQHHSRMLGIDIRTTFQQHCLNIVARSLPKVGDQHRDNNQTMWYECRGNVTSYCWRLMLGQHSSNVVYQHWSLTLYQHCCAMLYLVAIDPEHPQASLHWNSHIYSHFWVLPPTTALELMGRWWWL